MKVDYNNLRKQALYSYDKLAKKLNRNLKESEKDTGVSGEFYDLHADDIQECMDDLRSQLGMIACVYEEGNEEFANLEDICDSIAWFNPEKEDEDE